MYESAKRCLGTMAGKERTEIGDKVVKRGMDKTVCFSWEEFTMRNTKLASLTEQSSYWELLFRRARIG
jgi:hypothetical protein